MNEKSLEDLIKLLKNHTVVICWVADFHPFALEPQQYLEFADETLKRARRSQDKASQRWQSLVISGWNFTRQALECRCDELLASFGLLAKVENSNLDAKLALLRQAGVTAPHALQSLVQRRNDLQHRYVRPHDEDETELGDALGLIDMFLKSTEQYLSLACPGWGATVLVNITKRAESPGESCGSGAFADLRFPIPGNIIEDCYVAIDLVDLDRLREDDVADPKGSKLRVIWTKPSGAHPLNIPLSTQDKTRWWSL